MAYEINYQKFVVLVQDPALKKLLLVTKLPDDSFYGESIWKIGKSVKVNISAKTSEANISFLESKFNITRVGLNLELKGDSGNIRFIKSSKSASGSRNVLGKALADAGELATVKSLVSNIKVPRDTGQTVFINDIDSFMAWENTFKYTKVAVNKIVPTLSHFDIIHDATDVSAFTQVIKSFCKKVGKTKDSWNPADIFIIHRTHRTEIIKSLGKIVNDYDMSTGLVDLFNNKIYTYYKLNLLYPISLKQLVSSTPSVDYNNVPGTTGELHEYNISIGKFTVNMSEKGKEIGALTFKNNDTNKQISMQVRGFPHSYGTAQTEITNDGTPSGGRLGKVSTAVLDSILSSYGDSRINSISFFGSKPKVFSAFTDSVITETYGWYKTVVSHTSVSDVSPITLDDYKKLIELTKTDYSVAENLCMKIQGLKIMHFFITNEKNISPIMNKIINGAKKISNNNGFFIKIY